MTPGGRSSEVALLLIVLPLLGCGSSEQKKTELAEQEVRSWTATVRLARESLAAGAVPPVYARQVLEAARKGRQQQSKLEWKAIPPEARSQLDRGLRELEFAIERRAPPP
jgi:hypothetical protein